MILLKTKYAIIFQIALNHPPEVHLMKDYILQTVANLMDDLELLVSISDFQDNLTTEFEKRGNLQQYKTFLVPACKKSLTVNETKVNPDKNKDTKIDPAVAKKMKSEYAKRKKTDSEDIKFKTDMHNLAAELIL